MWWKIHWLFCNWDFLKLADGALVLSPLQACATYGKRMHSSLFAICSFWTGTSFRPCRCMLGFLHMYDRFEENLSPTCSRANHIHPHEGAARKAYFVQLIGRETVETDSNWHWVGLFGSAALRLCKARIWQNHWSKRDFWFSLLFCYQDQEGNG